MAEAEGSISRLSADHGTPPPEGPTSKETSSLKTGPSAPRVWLNPVAVWESLDQLARLADISPGHLSLLINGKRSPAPKVRRWLMKALALMTFTSCLLWSRRRLEAGTPSGPPPPTRKDGTPGPSE